jgi:hypothetical protein
VKQGYGFALIREGTVLDTELITRPIVGVDWTVDTAIVYNKVRHPKTIPVLVRHLKRRLAASTNSSNLHHVMALPHGAKTVGCFDKQFELTPRHGLATWCKDGRQAPSPFRQC